MARQSDADDARKDARAQADLHRQYRPIGIGAVAAALEAKSDAAESAKAATDNRQDRQTPRKSYAA